MKVEPKDVAGWNFRQIGPVFFMCMSVLHSILQGDFPYAGVAGLVLIAAYHWAVGPAIKYRLIPGPRFRPFVGNLPELTKNEYPEALYQWFLKHGPVFRFFMGPTPIVVFCDPEIIKNVGVKLFQDFHDRAPMHSTETAEVGLVFSRGAYWAGARSAVMPLFHTERLEAYAPAMHGALSKLRAKIGAAASRGEPVEVKQLTQQLGIDIIGKAAFGVDFDAQNDSVKSPLVIAANRIIDSLKVGDGAPLDVAVGLFFPTFVRDWVWAVLRRIPGTLANVGFVNRAFLMDVAERTANERRTRGKEDVMRSSDFLTYLARTACVKDTGRKLSDKEIRAIAMEVLLAGSETVATTIAMAVFFLSHNPEAREKVYEEVDRNSKAGIKKPGFSDLSKYPYVEQVVKETLRMFPTAPLLGRTAERDVDVGGVRIPKGTRVWLATNVTHRMELHFPEPERFRPERFDPTCQEQIKRHPYAYLPFGLGPRMCVGFKFAMEEAQLALITLYQSFTFELRPDTPRWPLKVRAGIVMRPAEDIVLKVHLR